MCFPGAVLAQLEPGAADGALGGPQEPRGGVPGPGPGPALGLGGVRVRGLRLLL